MYLFYISIIKVDYCSALLFFRDPESSFDEYDAFLKTVEGMLKELKQFRGEQTEE